MTPSLPNAPNRAMRLLKPRPDGGVSCYKPGAQRQRSPGSLSASHVENAAVRSAVRFDNVVPLDHSAPSRSSGLVTATAGLFIT
jgi:hypothetical protein